MSTRPGNFDTTGPLQLNFPVRVQVEGDAIIDLTNISEAPQPEGLFEVPVGPPE
jgi:hypothetical protein